MIFNKFLQVTARDKISFYNFTSISFTIEHMTIYAQRNYSTKTGKINCRGKRTDNEIGKKRNIWPQN